MGAAGNTRRYADIERLLQISALRYLEPQNKGKPDSGASITQIRCTKITTRGGGTHALIQTAWSRVYWNSLVGAWGLRERGVGSGVSQSRDRLLRSRSCFWSNSPNYGVRRRPHLWLPSQPGRFLRLVGRQALSLSRFSSVHYSASPRRDCRRVCALSHRNRQSGV